MPTQNEALVELYRRGSLSEPQKAAVEELGRRGVLNLGGSPTPRGEGDYRSQLMTEMAGEVGPLEAALIGTGKGFMNVARGVGLADEPLPEDIAGYEALSEARPYTTGAGEIVGEAAPFLPAGMGVGNIVRTGARVAATGLAGATEGAIVSEGRGEDALVGAGIGGGIGVGAEMLFPVIGKMGRKIYQKTMGKIPSGAMLDATGKPTAELSEALQKAGISFEDLTQDATEVISGAKPGTNPEQLARKALFAEEGIPATTGEIAGDTLARAKEQELFQTMTTASEPLRQYKLAQSDKIKETLGKVFGDIDPERLPALKEEAGEIIHDALIGRKTLLRTTKNNLYKESAEAAGKHGDVLVFTDNIKEAIPEKKILRRLSRTHGPQIDGVQDLLVEFGMDTSDEAVEQFVKTGGEITPLSVGNYDDFSQALSAIERSDQTGAIKVATGPIRDALEAEIDEVAGVLKSSGAAEKVLKPLRAGRKVVRQMKAEFSPESIIGKLIDVKKDGVTQITEASKIYDRMIGGFSSASKPVENIRKLVSSLSKSPKGEQALASLQATVMLDLIDSGFSTKSRKIGADIVFNPVAFKNRLKAISKEKISAIFGNNPDVLKKLNNIDKISSELIPPDMTVLKGSAPIITKIADQLGFYAIASHVPGGAILMGALKGMADPVKQGAAVKAALKATPEVEAFKALIERQFPGIASAIAIPIAIDQGENK